MLRNNYQRKQIWLRSNVRSQCTDKGNTSITSFCIVFYAVNINPMLLSTLLGIAKSDNSPEFNHQQQQTNRVIKVNG